jgi:hypothetical protein
VTDITVGRQRSVAISSAALLALSLALFANFGAVAGAHAAGSRLLATGGVMQVEGAAGGGLTPWALIAGLGTDTQLGGSAYCTRVRPDHFTLTSCGLAVGVHDRLELSYARQEFDLGNTVPGQSIRVDVFGAKLRLLGDAVYDQDRWYPQLALGVQYKSNRDFDLVPSLLGAHAGKDADWYLAATKLWLDGPGGRFALLNLTARATRANQLGILGFGGDRRSGRSLQLEGSAALFLTDAIAAGIEYRQKPDNLGVFREDDYQDVFIAWFPTKHWSVTVAGVDLGNLADHDNERGWYLSLQGGF